MNRRADQRLPNEATGNDCAVVRDLRPWPPESQHNTAVRRQQSGDHRLLPAQPPAASPWEGGRVTLPLGRCHLISLQVAVRHGRMKSPCETSLSPYPANQGGHDVPRAVGLNTVKCVPQPVPPQDILGRKVTLILSLPKVFLQARWLLGPYLPQNTLGKSYPCQESHGQLWDRLKPGRCR